MSLTKTLADMIRFNTRLFGRQTFKKVRSSKVRRVWFERVDKWPKWIQKEWNVFNGLVMITEFENFDMRFELATEMFSDAFEKKGKKK